MSRTTFSILALGLYAVLAVTPATATAISSWTLWGPGSTLYIYADYLVDDSAGPLSWQGVHVSTVNNMAALTGVFQCSGPNPCTGATLRSDIHADAMPQPSWVSLVLDGVATGPVSLSFSSFGNWGGSNVSLGAVSVSGVTGLFHATSGLQAAPPSATGLSFARSTFVIDSLAPGASLTLSVTGAAFQFVTTPEPATFAFLGGGLGLLALFLRRKF